MAKPKTGGSEFLQAMQEAADILTGDAAPARVWHPPTVVDVRAIRHGTRLSQAAFARRFGFSPGAVRDREQGRRRPDPAARTLLLVIARSPEAVEDAIRAGAPVAA